MPWHAILLTQQEGRTMPGPSELIEAQDELARNIRELDLIDRLVIARAALAGVPRKGESGELVAEAMELVERAIGLLDLSESDTLTE
jgi:hypothetical protein